MSTPKKPDLLYLWHPGKDIFSGYGLALAPAHLVGLVIIDRPTIAEPAWLKKIEETFGAYQLAVMAQTGERGMVCQMHIAQESILHLKTVDHPLARAIRSALLPLLNTPPPVTLTLAWHQASGFWISTIVKGGEDGKDLQG